MKKAFLNNNTKNIISTPKIGDVVYTKRALYCHYGIYVNNNCIVEFAPPDGFELDAKRALIRTASIDSFLNGGQLFIDTKCKKKYSNSDIATRALSCVGLYKGNYNLIFNNCEHFVKWCCSGVFASYQANKVIKGLLILVIALLGMEII